MRLVDADEIKKRERDVVLANGAKHRCFDTTMLFEIPTVDLDEIIAAHEQIGYEQGSRDGYAEALTDKERHGHWTDRAKSILGLPTEACSECAEWSLGFDKNYCPNCGAKMDEQET